MDHRHQSEREYIRYHGATSGEHLVAGIHGLAHGVLIWHSFPEYSHCCFVVYFWTSSLSY